MLIAKNRNMLIQTLSELKQIFVNKYIKYIKIAWEMLK